MDNKKKKIKKNEVVDYPFIESKPLPTLYQGLPNVTSWQGITSIPTQIPPQIPWNANFSWAISAANLAGTNTWDETMSSILDKIVTTWIVAPTSTPTKIWQFYIDTVAAKVYMATGISSSTDRTILN